MLLPAHLLLCWQDSLKGSELSFQTSHLLPRSDSIVYSNASVLCVSNTVMHPLQVYRQLQMPPCNASLMTKDHPRHASALFYNFAFGAAAAASISAYISSMRPRYFFAVCGRLSLSLWFCVSTA